MENILKPYAEDENNSSFSTTSEMFLFDVTSLYKNISVVDTLNMTRIMLITMTNVLGKCPYLKTSFLTWSVWF